MHNTLKNRCAGIPCSSEYLKGDLRVHHVSFILIGITQDKPARVLLAQLQHDVGGKQIRRVLLTAKHRHFQLIENRMPGLMQEHVHKGAKYGIFLCNYARQSLL